MKPSSWLCASFFVLAGHAQAAVTATILAGGETALPADTPSGRLDTAGEFSFVGALAISGGGGSYKGSAVALSREWVLTAGHNVDLNDDGLPDALWSGTFHLPGVGSFGVAQAFTHPGFTGFAQPAVNDDLALLRLATPLPAGVGFPTLASAAGLGEIITLVGFGRSGYGSYGYSSNATLTDRRFGSNAIDSFQLDDEGSGRAEVFRYDFDAPGTTGLPGGSLGNGIETIIGPGDSGGAALRMGADGCGRVGVGGHQYLHGRLRRQVRRYRRRGVGGTVCGLDCANHPRPGTGNCGVGDARRGGGGMAAGARGDQHARSGAYKSSNAGDFGCSELAIVLSRARAQVRRAGRLAPPTDFLLMKPQYYPVEEGVLYAGEYPGSWQPEIAGVRLRYLIGAATHMAKVCQHPESPQTPAQKRYVESWQPAGQ